MTEPVSTVVEPPTGPVRGRIVDGVARFLGVPYAEAARLGPPHPRPPSTAVVDGSRPGPAAPQTPSRLEDAVGPIDVTEQDEDCLSLDVWVPAGDDPGARPVLVWLHGGAFLTGSGSQSWYDGARLARRQGIVVVTVTYRLGALGYLYLPPSGGRPEVANLGLQDQVAALRWVRSSIAAFGGDPERITVAGQSAGAQSALALMHRPDAPSLFSRALLHSAPLGLPPLAPDEAARRTAAVFAQLGIDHRDQLADVPVPVLLAAQTAVARDEAGPFRLGPAFQLVGDGVTVPPDLLEPPAPVAAVGLAATAHEADVFTAGDPRLHEMSTPELVAALRRALGPDADDRYREHTREQPQLSRLRVASDLVTRHFFTGDLDAVARHLRDRGSDVTTRRTSWHPAGSPWRAGHCIDLPFLFDRVDAWRDSPLLHGATPDELGRETDDAQQYLARQLA